MVIVRITYKMIFISPYYATLTSENPDTGATTGTSAPIFKQGNSIAFKGGRSGKYCTDSSSKLICNVDDVGALEKFSVFHLGDGVYSLRGARTNKICSTGNGNSSVAVCDLEFVRRSDFFTIKDVGNRMVSIKSLRHNEYCTDDDNGFICNRDTVGPWESFSWQSFD